MTPAQTKRQSFYLPELDGLRFVAFLLVFIHNSPYIISNPISAIVHSYGWIGVDIFFSLSAYLITKLLLIEYEQIGKIGIANFYFRRILRIWPLYYFTIIVTALFLFQSKAWNLNTAEHFWGLATFTDNIIIIALGVNPVFYLVHLWSISYEEQFYTLIPWALHWLMKLSIRTKITIIGIVFLSGTILRAVFIYLQIPHPVIYELPFTRFESILGGIVIGLGLLDKTLDALNDWALFLTVSFCVAVVTLLPNIEVIGWNLILSYPLVGITTSLILYITLSNRYLYFRKILLSKVFIYLGKISYGLYVYHLPCLYFLSKIIERLGITSQHLIIYPVTMSVLGLTLTIFISILSYQIIERPFLQLKRRFAPISSRPI